MTVRQDEADPVVRNDGNSFYVREKIIQQHVRLNYLLDFFHRPPFSFVEKDGEKVNGKSIMGLMMLAAGPGSKIIVSVNGKDGHAALEEIEALLNRKFDEE